MPIWTVAVALEPRGDRSRPARLAAWSGRVAGWISLATRTSQAVPAEAAHARARPLARAALECDPQTEQPPKSSCATRFCKRRPTRWVPAFLAVAGYFPHSHEIVSKAYTQLARIWYRRGDRGGARNAGSRAVAMERREEARSRSRSMPMRIAIKLEKGRLRRRSCRE